MHALDVSLYLEGAPLPADADTLTAIRDAAMSDMLTVQDEMRGNTRIAPWTTRVLRDEFTEGFDVSHDVETTREGHDGEPDYSLIREEYGDDLHDWIVENDDEEQFLAVGYTAAAYGCHQTTGDWLAEQDQNVLIEDFGPEQPKPLEARGDGGATEYWRCLRALHEQCHYALGVLDDGEGLVPDAEHLPPERRRGYAASPFVPWEVEPVGRVATVTMADAIRAKMTTIREWRHDALKYYGDLEEAAEYDAMLDSLRHQLDQLAEPWRRDFDPIATDRRKLPPKGKLMPLPNPVMRHFGSTLAQQHRNARTLVKASCTRGGSFVDANGNRYWRPPNSPRRVLRFIDHVWSMLERPPAEPPPEPSYRPSPAFCSHGYTHRCPFTGCDAA